MCSVPDGAGLLYHAIGECVHGLAVDAGWGRMDQMRGIQVGLVNIWKKNGVVRICPFVGGLF